MTQHAFSLDHVFGISTLFPPFLSRQNRKEVLSGDKSNCRQMYIFTPCQSQQVPMCLQNWVQGEEEGNSEECPHMLSFI